MCRMSEAKGETSMGRPLVNLINVRSNVICLIRDHLVNAARSATCHVQACVIYSFDTMTPLTQRQ